MCSIVCLVWRLEHGIGCRLVELCHLDCAHIVVVVVLASRVHSRCCIDHSGSHIHFLSLIGAGELVTLRLVKVSHIQLLA